MNEYSNSSAVWRRGESRAGCLHRFVDHLGRTAPGRPKPRQTRAVYPRLEQEFISNAINARPSLVAPASCRRFFAQALRSTFLGNLRPDQRSPSPIPIATPKRLKFPISSTKQTSPAVSNRYKITGYCKARFEFSSVASACPVYPETRRGPRRASSERISAPFTSRKIAVKMPVLRRPGGTFLSGTPKQLEITVIHRKQTLASVSNRDTNSRSGVARLDRFSAANRWRAGHSLTRLDADASVPRLPIARKTNP
jgi:hypothetical protein